jgi:hypothetical protein
MYISEANEDRKRHDENLEQQSNADRAAHIIAEKFALTIPHAREVVTLAGLGSEARS